MFLEILTRHRPGRPRLLARCIESVDRQTDDDWGQTILEDDRGRGLEWANHNLARYAPHLEGEYIWILDDDDVSVCDTLVAELKAIVDEHDPDVIMLRLRHGEHGLLPDDSRWGETPTFAHVGISCFVLRRSVYQAEAAWFKAPTGADYQMIRGVWDGGYRIYWHDRVVAECDRQHHGAAVGMDPDCIGVVSCVWQRPERLAITLEMLAGQTDQNFVLYLIVNNPALVDFVDEALSTYAGPVVVVRNAGNRGPYARIEVMHDYADEHPFFLTVDDDADFPADWVAQWRAKRVDGTMQGWNGFLFRGDYWTRSWVYPGVACHYLWGSNLAVPAEVVADPRVLELDPRFWQCDDLWLCYFANHVMGVALQPAEIEGFEIAVDGKDAYLTQHNRKIEALEMLRGRGWQV